MAKSRFQEKNKNLLNLLPKKLVTKEVYLATLPVTVFVTVFIIPLEINRPIEYVYWLVIGLSGHLAMLPFVIYGRDRQLLKEQVPLLLAMGFVRGLVIWLVQPLFGFEDHYTIMVRAANSAVFVFYMFQLLAIIYEFHYGLRRKISRILEQMALKKQHLNLRGPIAHDNELLQLVAKLQEKITFLILEKPSSTALNESAESIDTLVREHIRPLSKSKWRDGEIKWVKLGFFHVLRRAMTLSPIPIFEIYLLTLPLVIVAQISRFNFSAVVTTQAIWIVFLLFAVKILKFLFPSNPYNFFRQNVTIVLLVSLTVVPVFYFANRPSPMNLIYSQNWILTCFYAFLMSAIILLISTLLVSLNIDQEKTLSFLENQLDGNNLTSHLESRVQSIRDLDYSNYLHNEVQSQLLACKLLLLKSAESDSQMFPPVVLTQIISRLEKIKKVPLREIGLTPSERMKQFVHSWQGIAEIHLDLPARFDEIPSNRFEICQLMEEAVINSIRHGQAKMVKISVSFLDELIVGVVSDDGIFVENKSDAGLGTILFDTFTKHWEIKSEGKGTTLRFSLEMPSLDIADI
jgi:hypothetical protein